MVVILLDKILFPCSLHLRFFFVCLCSQAQQQEPQCVFSKHKIMVIILLVGVWQKVLVDDEIVTFYSFTSVSYFRSTLLAVLVCTIRVWKVSFPVICCHKDCWAVCVVSWCLVLEISWSWSCLSWHIWQLIQTIF